MPDDRGVLTPDEITKLIAFLNGLSMGRRQECPICGDDKWEVGPQVVQPLTLDGTWQPNFGLAGYPFVMVISPKCGYTRLINAVVAGVIVPPEKKD